MSTLKEVVEQYELTYIEGDINHNALYKLWTTGEMFDTEKSSGLELNYIGLYYAKVKQDYQKMKMYYLMAIERGDSNAMNNLGLYYEFTEVELMKQYYLMAIELGNSNAMNNLGHYYENTEVDSELMMRYYLMAIERGNSAAMVNLGRYYENTEVDSELMMRYYLMAIERGNSLGMNNLGHYYHHTEVDPELMKRYYLMAIERGDSIAMNNLGYYYQYTEVNSELMKRYYLMAIEKGDSIAMFNLGNYYQFTEVDTELMKRYYLMAIERDSPDAMQQLGFYYRNIPELMMQYYFMALKIPIEKYYFKFSQKFILQDLRKHYNKINRNYNIILAYLVKNYEEWVHCWKYSDKDIVFTDELIEHLINVDKEHLNIIPKSTVKFVEMVNDQLSLNSPFKILPNDSFLPKKYYLKSIGFNMKTVYSCQEFNNYNNINTLHIKDPVVMKELIKTLFHCLKYIRVLVKWGLPNIVILQIIKYIVETKFQFNIFDYNTFYPLNVEMEYSDFHLNELWKFAKNDSQVNFDNTIGEIYRIYNSLNTVKINN